MKCPNCGSENVKGFPIWVEGKAEPVQIDYQCQDCPCEFMMAPMMARLTDKERELVSALEAKPTSSNKQLGEMLGITPRTVVIHLNNIYRKLGIEGGDGSKKKITLIMMLKD